MNEKDTVKGLKKRRHNAIIKLISENAVETQGQLTHLLIEGGFDVTQATVSRDIKELRLIKITDVGDKYRYALPGRENDADIRARYAALLKHSAITIQSAMNLVIVKTLPGSAQGCAMAIETLEFENIVGSLAGDDTVFIATNTAEDAVALVEQLTDFTD